MDFVVLFLGVLERSPTIVWVLRFANLQRAKKATFCIPKGLLCINESVVNLPSVLAYLNERTECRICGSGHTQLLDRLLWPDRVPSVRIPSRTCGNDTGTCRPRFLVS
jgi:hypothetical protein